MHGKEELKKLAPVAMQQKEQIPPKKRENCSSSKLEQKVLPPWLTLGTLSLKTKVCQYFVFDTLSLVRTQEGRPFCCAMSFVLKQKKFLLKYTVAGDGTRCQMINFLYIFVFVEKRLDFCKCDVIDMGTAKSHR